MPSKKYSRAQYINGRLLKKIIKIRKVTQQEISEGADLGINTLNRAINNNRLERISKVFKVCELLNVDPSLIMSDNVTSLSDGVLITDENIDQYIDEFPYPLTFNCFLDFSSDEHLFQNNNNYQFVDPSIKIVMHNILGDVSDILVDLYFEADSDDYSKINSYIYENIASKLSEKYVEKSGALRR